MRLNCASNEQNSTTYNSTESLNLTKYVQDMYTKKTTNYLWKKLDNPNKQRDKPVLKTPY